MYESTVQGGSQCNSYTHTVFQFTKFSESMRSLAHEAMGRVSGPRTKSRHSNLEMQPEKGLKKDQSARPADSRQGWYP